MALLVRRVPHPGAVHHKGLGSPTNNGGELGLDSPTFLSSVGWNWVPTIRGRNVGIWNEVRFETTGQVLLEDPWVTTDRIAPDHSVADLSVHLTLRNLSQQPQQSVLSLSVNSDSYRKDILLAPHESRTLSINRDEWRALAQTSPQLWWPNGYGDPTLHTLGAQLSVEGQISDSKTIHFGIRQVEYLTRNQILNIHVNGHKILCRGGNWGMDNGMLICDDSGYDLRVRMHRDMNLVMIRNWVGMVGRKAFYEACDRYGILVWDDFWLANPSDGPDPCDHGLFMSNVRDKVRRVRQHPSVVLYCGRNEGLPPAVLDEGMRKAVQDLDGTRLYISNSAAGLVSGFGPYDNQDPKWYFANRGTTLHSEQGIVCVPPVESLRAMMPEEALWPINDMWAIHDYQYPRSDRNTQRIAQRYGTPRDAEDYCRKAQLLNLETAKAIYECLRSHQGSGILIWMTQSAWPSLICQLYDHFFEQTGAYFGAKSACEPCHILWDQDSNSIKVANNTTSHLGNLAAEAHIYSLAGKKTWSKRTNISVPVATAKECFTLGPARNVDEVSFLRLRLTREGETISHNCYWMESARGDCVDLNNLVQAQVTVSALCDPNGRGVRATITNATDAIAVAVRLKTERVRDGARMLPAIYEDNYLTLFPQEKRTVNIKFPTKTLAGEMHWLVVEGWNVERVYRLIEEEGRGNA
jgi:hypothetical protein